MKRKLTAAVKAEKTKRQMEYMTIFMNGMRKRVKRPPAIDGLDVDDVIRRDADPIWIHQNERWEYMVVAEQPFEIYPMAKSELCANMSSVGGN